MDAEHAETFCEIDQREDQRELKGVALVLAAVVRFGQHELAYQIADSFELDYAHFVPVADEADLKELREALAG